MLIFSKTRPTGSLSILSIWNNFSSIILAKKFIHRKVAELEVFHSIQKKDEKDFCSNETIRHWKRLRLLQNNAIKNDSASLEIKNLLFVIFIHPKWKRENMRKCCMCENVCVLVIVRVCALLVCVSLSWEQKGWACVCVRICWSVVVNVCLVVVPQEDKEKN